MQATINSWNGKFKLVVNKKSFKLYKNNKLILKEKIQENKTVYDIIKDKIAPDVYKFGNFSIRYYGSYIDSADLKEIEQHIHKISQNKAFFAKLSIDSYDNTPKITVIGKDNKGTFYKNFSRLEDFEKFQI